MLAPFAIALQFLTLLPVRRAAASDADVGRSLVAYPFVGLIIGALVGAVAWSLERAPVGVAAVIVLIVWVTLTGALHLDGLADSADAWAGGLGNRERTLEIMKDPRRGSIALVVVALLLLGKYAALEALIAQHRWLAIGSVPVLGRAAVQALLLTTPYVRPGGIGAALTAHQPRGWVAASLVLAVACVIAFEPLRGSMMTLAAAIVLGLLRLLMMRRLGGTTGDTAGASIELTELAALLTVSI
jgi:adenosylcobinamide-GDP ribazoletransferase